MAIRSFEDLRCWQEARQLVNLVFEACRSEPMKRDYGTCDQIRRASISTMNNIAEGFGRQSHKEFIRFLDFAQSSAMEVKSMTYVLEDQQYLVSMRAIEMREKAEWSKVLYVG